MPTYRRWRVEGGEHFLTVVTHERRRFLSHERSRRFLREAICNARGLRPFQIEAMVLLPDHRIRDDEDYRNHIEYILYNPVKHQLADSAGQWPWSSFHRFAALGWIPAEWCGPEDPNVLGDEPEFE